MSNTLNDRLSNSKSYVWNKCKKNYALQYLEKLYPQKHVISVENWWPRAQGVLIHAGMEAGMLRTDVLVGVQSAAAEMVSNGLDQAKHDSLYGGMIEEAAQVAENCLEWLPASDWEPVQFRGLPMVEAEISHPLPGWRDFMGYIDLVAKHIPSGLTFVVDYKSRERFSNPEDEQFSSQFLYYMKALRHMGVHVDGAFVVQLKPQLPKRKPTKTRIDEGGVMGPRESECGRFRTIPTMHSQEYIDNAWRQLEIQAAQMSKFTLADAHTNISSFGCGKCDYRKLCMAELRGEDAEYIRKTSYQSSGRSGRTLPPSLNIVI